MKCQFCEKEYSDSVAPIHIEWCGESTHDKEDEPDQELIALREKAKELGIKNTGSKKRETLEKEITEAVELKDRETAENQLKSLREKAESLGINEVDKKDADALTAEIAAKEQG